jgi:hypothetical protein
MRAEGGVRYACVGVAVAVALGRRGVDGPATGTSGISTSEVNDALRTGIVRVRGVVRGRFEGVSGGKALSSSDEADISESEKATLRFVLLVREGVRFAERRADLVGDADREWEGVVVAVVGVFDDLSSVVAFFLRIPFIVPLMDSFKSAHPSSSIFTRREKILIDTPCFSTRGFCVMVESWEGDMSVGKNRGRIRATHLDSLTNPEKYRYSYVCPRIGDTGRELFLITW